MGRPKKDKTPSELLDDREKRLDAREAELNARDAILLDMPEGEELSEAQVKAWFTKTRKIRLAQMLAIATKSDSERTRRDMLLRLDDMDIGKPGSRKRTDEEQADGVSIIAGKYGIPNA